ncbi:MAG: pantoate--beta-alanine ligase [Oligoflexia bacterium]|nr:pantoate--beta-alanine ligase [Oligoflexia bacterium]
MKVFETIADWRKFREALEPGTIGFVPTMGALHAGHASLLKKSASENAWTVASIFVNPTQFNDPKDLENYPRTLEPDLALAESCGVDFVLSPSSREELYPDGYRYRVSENDFSNRLCGAHRPGHFEGMLTVVLKLLNLVAPTRAYFGEKDFQQLALIQGMAKAFFLPIEIIGCPTAREADGLAMSSRNTRLAPGERELAARFPRILSNRELSASQAAEELARSGFEVDYVEDRDGRRFGAVRLGNVRLIDNFGNFGASK